MYLPIHHSSRNQALFCFPKNNDPMLWNMPTHENADMQNTNKLNPHTEKSIDLIQNENQQNERMRNLFFGKLGEYIKKINRPTNHSNLPIKTLLLYEVLDLYQELNQEKTFNEQEKKSFFAFFFDLTGELPLEKEYVKQVLEPIKKRLSNTKLKDNLSLIELLITRKEFWDKEYTVSKFCAIDAKEDNDSAIQYFKKIKFLYELFAELTQPIQIKNIKLHKKKKNQLNQKIKIANIDRFNDISNKITNFNRTFYLKNKTFKKLFKSIEEKYFLDTNFCINKLDHDVNDIAVTIKIYTNQLKSILEELNSICEATSIFNKKLTVEKNCESLNRLIETENSIITRLPNSDIAKTLKKEVETLSSLQEMIRITGETLESIGEKIFPQETLQKELFQFLNITKQTDKENIKQTFCVINTEIENIIYKIQTSVKLIKIIEKLTIDSTNIYKEDLKKNINYIDGEILFASEIETEKSIQRKKILRKKAKWKTSTPLPIEQEQITTKKTEKKLTKNVEKKNEYALDSVVLFEEKMLGNFLKSEIISSLKSKQELEAMQDTCYHLAILGSCIDFMRIKNKEQNGFFKEKSLMCPFIRSTSIATEQWMTGKLLHNENEINLTHDHIQLAEQLNDQKSSNFLKTINYGNVFTRYPNGTRLIFSKNEKEIPKAFNYFSESTILEKNGFEELALGVSIFFENKIPLNLENDVIDFPKKTLADDLKISKQLDQPIEIIDDLVNKYEKIIEEYESKQKNTSIQLAHTKCKDIIWHLKDLSQILSLMKKNSIPTRFLLLFGDSILWHLQLIIELSFTHRLIAEKNEIIFSHNLQDLYELNDFENVSESSQEALNAIDTHYGAQYPNRRRESIDGYNRAYGSKEGYAEMPAAITWRLNAKELIPFGDEIDMDMTHNSKKKKTGNRTKAKKLYEELLKWTQELLKLASL